MTELFSGSILAMVCGGLFALAFGVIGIVLIVLYFRNKNKAKASETWPQVEGRVISTNIRVDEIDDEESSRIRYVPEVHFEYEIGEMTFEGKRIAFGSEPSFGLRKKAAEFLEQYPQDRVVTVFYNPEDPGEGVLSQKMRSMTVGLIVGIVMVIMMICLMCPLTIGLVNTFFPS